MSDERRRRKRLRELGPRIGEQVSPADWTPISNPVGRNPEPFKFGRAGDWVAMWSELDGKICAIAGKVENGWSLRFKNRMQINGRTIEEVVEKFCIVQEQAVASATLKPRFTH